MQIWEVFQVNQLVQMKSVPNVEALFIKGALCTLLIQVEYLVVKNAQEKMVIGLGQFKCSY